MPGSGRSGFLLRVRQVATINSPTATAIEGANVSRLLDALSSPDAAIAACEPADVA
ncbi:hypothetical protein Rrhod_4125 [Rhodococcus rhodnii LMG 5362]|uniref:Uncharacterized protein n=1 Tax=Rhodococcus rhodnii LMG 5362 TaxID=1273125 RepID=R7WHF5_9NOCA|nr:hypothetical protein Rrhod_4125 [Rhodococcus rhodnii LMG 5362]